jgi:hypothetical protein
MKQYDSPFFEAFWQAYPRKIGKALARKRYEQAIKKVSDERLVHAAIEFSDHVNLCRTETRFIPHASTWLSQERWENDLSAERSGIDNRQGQTGLGILAARQIAQKNKTPMEREEREDGKLF